MKFSTCALLTAVLLAQTGTAEAKSYKGAEVYTIQTVLYGRVEIRMRMIRGSGLISTFFTYKNGSETNGTLWEETDIEALGKNDAKSWQSNLITGNPRVTSEQVYTATSSLADGYHTYALEWTPDYVSWSFDGTMVRKTQGGQASNLTNPETLRFNAWASDSTGWAGALDDTALPAYQFVNWIKYYKYDNGQFVLDWTDDFDSFDTTRWGTGNWTFDGNLVDFDPANAVVQDGTLILALTKEGATGFSGTVPVDDGSTNTDGGVTTSDPHSDSGCAIGGSELNGAGALFAMLLALVARRRSRLAIGRLVHRLRRLAFSKAGLTLAALIVGLLLPRAAAAVVQGAELYHTRAYFYGRFEARVRFAPGEGVVSSFFLWKDGSDTAASWDELDFEKINSDCRLQTNIWSGKGAQSAMINTPSFNICNDYHTYAFEWTPDYIAWFIDGTQVRKETGARVTEYAQNATIGMSMHFNIWQGDSSFGGNLSTATLPVYQYVSWAQYSSYANGAFQMQWREDFTGSTAPTNWALGDWMAPLNHSKHNMANVKFVNGIAVLALTNDGATGYTGTPPADPAGGTGGTSGSGGTSGAGGAAGTSGAAGRGGTTGSGGAAGRGGTTGSGGGAAGRGGTTGSGGTPGTAGASATGGTPGTAGASATGGTPGTAGSSPTGDPQGTAGSSATGTAGTGDVTGAAGTSGPSGAAGDNPTGSGAGGSGTISGQAGSTGQTGGDSGCSCDVSAARSGGATGALLFLALVITARRRRST
jgi:beta-glucanase (GH16 family)